MYKFKALWSGGQQTIAELTSEIDVNKERYDALNREFEQTRCEESKELEHIYHKLSQEIDFNNSNKIRITELEVESGQLVQLLEQKKKELRNLSKEHRQIVDCLIPKLEQAR